MERPPGPRFWILGVLLVALAIAAWVAERTASSGLLARMLRTQVVEGPALGRGNLKEVLQVLRAIHPIPIAPPRLATRVSPRRTDWQPQLYSAVRPSRKKMRKAFAIEPELFQLGVPTLSLLLAEEDLAELRENPRGRGRQWERPGYLHADDARAPSRNDSIDFAAMS